jgi:transglutaminase-like putative cysteine protease
MISASLAAPTIKQLEERQDYPEWYLKPICSFQTIFPPLFRMAQEITAGAETPYQKVTLVTNWLRENIEYQPVLPEIPQGQDPIEWMLFTQKQAFCNYYATAEVLMLRSLGIPARWVVGYNQGELDDSTDEAYYRVRDKNRHAWPEVFFPGLGWIEFEPKRFEPLIERSAAKPTQIQASRITGRNVEDDDLPERPEATEALRQPLCQALTPSDSILALLLFPLWYRRPAGWWLPYINRKKRDPERALAPSSGKEYPARGCAVRA